MAGSATTPWAIFGVILCGLILTIPFILIFYLVQFIKKRTEKRKERKIKDSTVI